MKFTEGMVCPLCEVGEIKQVSKDLEFEYKNEKISIQHHNVFECPNCTESFLNPKDERKLEKQLTDSRRKVDGLLTSDEIKKIRQQYDITQVQFAEVLRVAAKNFARYESGQATQGYAMDNLLRVMRSFPNTIREFSKDWTGKKNEHIYEIEAYFERKRTIETIVSQPIICTYEGEDYTNASSF